MARIDIENHHNLQSYLLNQKEVELIEAINQLFMFISIHANTIFPAVQLSCVRIVNLLAEWLGPLLACHGLCDFPKNYIFSYNKIRIRRVPTAHRGSKTPVRLLVYVRDY